MKRFGQDALATPANFVTLGRLLLAVPTLFLIERDGSTWLTWGLWFFLCATDSIDGWMARRHLNFQTAKDPKTKALRRINKVMIPALEAMKGGAYIVQTRMTEKGLTRYTAVDDLIKQLRDPMKANELLDLDVFTPEAHAECKRFADFLQEIQNKPSGPERTAAAKEFMYERYANEMFFVGY